MREGSSIRTAAGYGTSEDHGGRRYAVGWTWPSTVTQMTSRAGPDIEERTEAVSGCGRRGCRHPIPVEERVSDRELTPRFGIEVTNRKAEGGGAVGENGRFASEKVQVRRSVRVPTRDGEKSGKNDRIPTWRAPLSHGYPDIPERSSSSSAPARVSRSVTSCRSSIASDTRSLDSG